MKAAEVLVFCTLAIILTSMNVQGQCCGEPEEVIEPVGIDTVVIDNEQFWTGSKLVNGSLLINETLELRDCDLTISGEGIKILENGSLHLVNSSISPFLREVGYYIESSGVLEIHRSTINGSLDHSNQYFSLYLLDGSFSFVDSIMTRSGLIRSGLDSLEIINSTISGIISTGGSILVEDSVVEGLGASMVGEGNLSVIRTSFTSNISFSSSIAAISCEDGGLDVENVYIEGTYGGGIFSSGASVSARSVTIDLPGALYGGRFMECGPLELVGMDITGPYSGIEMTDCPGDPMIRDSKILSLYKGIDTKGPGALLIENTTIEDAENGIISSNHISIRGSSIRNTEVGLLLEGQWALIEMDCQIENFTRWGMEIETWDRVERTDVAFIPGDGALSNISMWGRTHINTYGPGMEVVDGSIIELSSSLNWTTKIGPGEVGLIWGYLGPSDEVITVEYDLSASWGNARMETSFIVMEDSHVDLQLPLTDIYVNDIELMEGNAVVTVGTYGSEAKNVAVTIYLDGTYRFSQKTNIVPGENITIILPVGKMEPGQHDLKCSIRSSDEYTGMNGILQDNNELTISVEKGEDTDDNELQIIAAIILIIAVVLIIMVLVLRRRS